jgi:hypothetical protein
MSEKDNIYTVKLIKRKGKLVHQSNGELVLYQEFIKSLAEEQVVEVFFEANKDDGTNIQLAKIHVCIRKLAVELGHTFGEMKMVIKQIAGLCWIDKDGKEYCKSFSKCSKEELTLVIEAINQAGDVVNISF